MSSAGSWLFSVWTRSKYDFDAAINLPVRGSSVFRGTRPKEYHWDPVEKTPDFNPVGRWNNWSRSTHERFNWIAGEKLVALGYEEKKFGKDKQLLWAVWNKALDVRWQLREFFRSDSDTDKGRFEVGLRCRQDVEIPASGIGFHKHYF